MMPLSIRPIKTEYSLELQKDLMISYAVDIEQMIINQIRLEYEAEILTNFPELI